ncbi:MAG: cytochrome c [Acidimicrobiia bacterium]|nr:cytochrome c [Acidimicrobiia bacterium]
MHMRTLHILGVGTFVCALVAAFTVAGHARQARTVADGVYSAAQAQRGAALSKAQCASCHGDMLEGVVGPMLAGDGFLQAWAGRTMTDLVDKIQNTMPLQAPGSLSRAQSIDIATYMLQASKLKPGQADLAAGALAQVTFAAAPRPAAAPAGGAGGVNLAPMANLAQLMRGVTFPNANIIFNVQVKDPGTTRPQQPVPFDYMLWGSTVYYGWQAVDQAAQALVETTPLFLLPGRRCENGRPVPVDRADYQKFTQDLVNVSREFYKLSQSRKQDAIVDQIERLNDACANCHKVYRDVGLAEGGGLGGDRCR